MENTAFGHLRWTSTSMTVQDALTRTFHSDVLTHLALYRIVDVPLDVVDRCSALEELSLELVDFLKQDMDAFFSGTWEPRTMRSRKTELKSLCVTLSDPLFHFISLWITSPVCNLSVASLQRFAASMTMEYYDHGNVDRILQACAATVQIFCFSPTFRTNLDDVGQTMNPINISGLSSLRILRLRVGVLAQALRRLNTHARQSYLQWIVELLSQLPSSTAVTEISLKVSLVKEKEMAGVNGVVDMDPWHRLDDLLASHAKHSIRQFKFIALEEEFDLPDDAARIIRNAFPQLQEARILIIEMSKAISGFFSAPDDGEFLERVKIR
ncbi:hypothetical protein BDN70DRAFT_237970 [Pholiota conissans]|uniref:Uncharacterized protein n=1 Tax=Pholiota conissans TaxID=109636 RepID=A0A9P5ZGW9_9AGAR|nr:hypothetical protein BDN70DRAFT_237970 [Pholiota conissans]